MAFTLRETKCAVCARNVYSMEKVVLGDRAYHKACFKCVVCDKRLMPGHAHLVDGKAYCLVHGAQMERSLKRASVIPTEMTLAAMEMPAEPKHPEVCLLCLGPVLGTSTRTAGVLLPNVIEVVSSLVRRSCHMRFLRHV